MTIITLSNVDLGTILIQVVDVSQIIFNSFLSKPCNGVSHRFCDPRAEGLRTLPRVDTDSSTTLPEVAHQLETHPRCILLSLVLESELSPAKER